MGSSLAPCLLLVGLLGLLTNLPTTLCSTTSPNEHQDTQSHSACNACCYGQPGQPGIPGVPGTPGGFGPTGATGSKGDRGELTRGEPGAKGQSGEHGNEGVKGNKGIEGSPGKQGPLGRMGLQGIKGDNGSKGDKGESGSQLRTSAFTALRTTHVPPAERVITFTTTELNAGEDFDKNSGKFTCQVSGVYFFMFSCLSYTPSGATTYVKMVLNGRVITTVHSSDALHEQLSSGATLQLNVGDQVWLVNDGRHVYGNSGHPLTFTGFMIFNLN